MLSRLRLFLTALAVLLGVTAGEKLIFTAVHADPALAMADVARALAIGLRFDFAVAAGFALLAYSAAHLLNRPGRLPFAAGLRHATFGTAILLILLHGGDLIYFGESGRHLGYELRESLNSGGALAAAAFSSYLGTVLGQLALIVPSWFWARLLFRRFGGEPVPRHGWQRYALPELAWFVVLLLSAVLIRGGFQHVPLEPLHAQSVGNPRLAAISLNGAYNALFSSLTPYSAPRVMAQPPTPEDRQQVAAMYIPSDPSPPHEPQRYNVVLLFLESWSAAYLHPAEGREPAPEFARLRAEGLGSVGMLADGHRTTEGMFATLCSAQNPLGATVAQTQLQNYDYECLPELLANQGYSSAFFQGTLENTSGTGAFAQLLGFGESYGKHDMPPPSVEPNSWGRHDPDLYAFALEKMKRMPQPFLVGINTNSTHDRHLPPGVEPAFPGDDKQSIYLSVMHYADAALGEFVRRLRASPEIGPTLVVMVGDHTGMAPGSMYYGHLVPFAVHAPGIVAPRLSPRRASQRDIAPTVLQMLGRPVPPWFTGKSLLSDDDPPYFSDLYNGALGWIEGDRLVTFSVRRPDEPRCYNLAQDPMMERPACDGQDDAQRTRRALAFTRVFQDLLFSGRVRDFSAFRATQNIQAFERNPK